MNRIHTIALFAGVFAVAMGTLIFTGFSGVSAMPLMTEAIPQTQDRAGILGHVTYTLFNADGDIKSYAQGDNVVVIVGKNCIASHIFSSTDDGPGGENTCGGNTSNFDFIAIGNGTGTSTDEDAQLDGATVCADTSNDGEMARVQVTPVIKNATTGNGAVVTLETLGGEVFTFANDATVKNTTTVLQSGLFDAQESSVAADGSCATLGFPGNPWNMFSIQDISVTTTDGDSLSIKWTITIG